MNDGGPAFPCHTNPRPDYLANAPQGMALRDYFAAAALQGEVANPSAKLFESEGITFTELAEDCYRIADAMLAARKEGS